MDIFVHILSSRRKMLNYILYGIIFLCLIGLSYLLAGLIQRKNVFSVVANAIKDSTKDVSSVRHKQEWEDFKAAGNTEKLNFFTRIDIAIEMSGLKTYFSWFNTELLLLIVSAVVFAAGITVFIFTQSVLYAVVTLGLCIFTFYAVVYLLNSRVTKIVDDNLLQFANLLYSYSNSMNDLVELFDVASLQLDEPLRGAVKKCVNEIRMFEGDTSAAFGRLILKVRHRKLTEMLQSLEEGSRNNADYRAILSRCYDSISIYKDQKEIRKTMARGARLNVAIMIGIFVLCLMMVLSITQTSFYEFYFASASGKIMFTYCVMVFIYTFWKMITMDR